MRPRNFRRAEGWYFASVAQETENLGRKTGRKLKCELRYVSVSQLEVRLISADFGMYSVVEYKKEFSLFFLLGYGYN